MFFKCFFHKIDRKKLNFTKNFSKKKNIENSKKTLQELRAQLIYRISDWILSGFVLVLFCCLYFWQIDQYVVQIILKIFFQWHYREYR